MKAPLFEEKVTLSSGRLMYPSDHIGLFVEVTVEKE